jgi:tripartite-type tricarboxylate transporter receptor subunit TctC
MQRRPLDWLPSLSPHLLAVALARFAAGLAGPAPALVVPFPPGGTTDVVSRLVATELAKALGQAVLVENKPGAGTVIGVDSVAKSAPMATAGDVANSFCVNQTLVKNLPYDSQRTCARWR